MPCFVQRVSSVWYCNKISGSFLVLRALKSSFFLCRNSRFLGRCRVESSHSVITTYSESNNSNNINNIGFVALCTQESIWGVGSALEVADRACSPFLQWRPEALFFRAELLERTGRMEDARAVYHRVLSEVCVRRRGRTTGDGTGNGVVEVRVR